MDRDYLATFDYEFEPPPAIYRELYPVHLKYAKPTLNISQDMDTVIVNQPHSHGSKSPGGTSTTTTLTRGLLGFESLIPVQSLKLTFSELNDCCPEICIKNVHGDLLFKGHFGTNLCCTCCQCHPEDKEVFINDLNERSISRLVFRAEACRCFDETDFYEIFAPIRQRVGTVNYQYNRGEQTFVIKNEISTEEFTVKRGIGENAHIKTVTGDVIAVVDINRPGRNIRPSYTLTFTQQEITLIDKILLIGFLISLVN
ncbi:unnamed protein product [Allacma fusca]|uniref:Phospholipid scramblase n=1 Tax=Allacma fusca TaxID=39272 RepID=A0A8J2L6N7_9HEXA|nr:unnamed protein product [Allacma fusca]